MSINFNADEIFEIAEKIETNGAKFYRAAAKAHAKMSELFGKLASMEDEHRIVFAALRTEAAGFKGDTSRDPGNDAKKYLQAIADGRVFVTRGDPASRITGKESPREVLQTAIGMEKDSIILYLGMRDFVPEKMGREKVDKIIAEEKRHIVILSEEMAKL